MSSPLGGLGEAMYAVCLRLIGKLVVDLFVLIKLYSLGVRAEALRPNID